MKTNIHHLFTASILSAAIVVCASCSEGKYHVEGTITEAEDSVLYFEHISLNGPVVLDQTTLKADGTFHFSQKAADAPEFYRLRIANRFINLAADSTETVTVKAAYPTMNSQYTVEGSYDCQKIKELTLLQMQLQNQIQGIARDPMLNMATATQAVDSAITAYKDSVKRNYIFAEPMKAYAYFALFQTLNIGGGQGVLIFNPNASEDDLRVYGAVATSWDTYFPHAERGQNLHNIAIQGMKDLRIIRNRQNQTIDLSQVDVSNTVDIALPDNKGKTARLSDLKGKVVLLDFHLFGSDNSTERIMALREVYNKYHAQGFEIYQIGYDANEHFWKTQTAALPWVCVYDAEGLGSLNLMRYNVQAIPTFFLVKRDNTIHKRDAQIEDLEKEIKSLL